MQRGRGPSWQVRWDFPEYLQLSGYIAQQEGFHPEDTLRPISSAETEWRTWWESLLIPATERGTVVSAWADPWMRVNYDPPAFWRLAHLPVVKSLCQRHFMDFHRYWGRAGGDKESMTTLLSERLKRLRIDKVVSACAAAAGKRESAPFILTVDFVMWPRDFRRIVSDSYVVLGRQYLDAERMTALRATLQELVAKLA